MPLSSEICGYPEAMFTSSNDVSSKLSLSTVLQFADLNKIDQTKTKYKSNHTRNQNNDKKCPK